MVTPQKASQRMVPANQPPALAVTPAVRRAAEAMEDAAMRLVGRDLGTIYRDQIAREALAAALPVECHEEVQGWTEDAAHPCNEPAVAYREDKYEPTGRAYPVCAKHATPDLAPLRAALLGPES